MSTIEQRLQEMQDAWENAQESSGFVKNWPPDGEYVAEIERFDFFDSKDGRHTFLKTEMRVVRHPKYEGMTVEAVHVLTDPDRLGWLKRHLSTLGVSLGRLADLPDALAEVVGAPVAIAVKTSSKTDPEGVPYRNVYVNARLSAIPSASDVPSDAKEFAPQQESLAVAEDDIPF